MARARPPSRGLLSALAVALVAMGIGGGARADTITFDPDGVGGANGSRMISGLDWAVGNAVAESALPITHIGQTFVNLYQAKLGTTLGDSSPIIGLNGLPATAGSFEITIVARFREVVTSIGPVTATTATVQFKTDVDQTGSFLEIYYDKYGAGAGGVRSNDLEGTGFDDGHLILTATVLPGDDGDSIFTSQFAPAQIKLLDGDGSDQRSGQKTVSGIGGSKIMGLVNPGYDTTFFQQTGILSLIATVFNTNLKLPFSETEPSKVFFKGSAVPKRQFTPVLGAINGVSGPDFLFQADASESFTVSPEPGTMVLAFTGLVTVSLGSLRRLRRRPGSPAA